MLDNCIALSKSGEKWCNINQIKKEVMKGSNTYQALKTVYVTQKLISNTQKIIQYIGITPKWQRENKKCDQRNSEKNLPKNSGKNFRITDRQWEAFDHLESTKSLQHITAINISHRCHFYSVTHLLKWKFKVLSLLEDTGLKH